MKADNYGHAEKCAAEHVAHYKNDGLPDVELKRVRFVDVLTNANVNADKWYKVKVELIALDENSMKEVRTAQVYLVQASDNTEAIALLNQYLSDGVSDFSIHTTIETKILDYLNFVDPSGN